MNNKLLVYDASAGSGKTYKLSEKFSDYLLEEFKRGNQDAYKFVMAVTFTNKATFEMKTRIINRLYERAKGISREDQNLSEEDKKQSDTILKHLVHDYTMFRVSTIDSFFQRVLKAFAVEMGSSSSYNTTLDQNPAIEAAMDNLYSKLDSDRELLSAVENISLSRIEEGKNWNWKDSLMDICRRVLDSEYQNYRPSSESLGIDGFEKLLKKGIADLQSCFVDPVIKLFNEMKDNANDRVLDGLAVKSSVKKFIRGELADSSRFFSEEKGRIIRKYPAVLADWLADPSGLLLKKGTQADIDAINEHYGRYLQGIKALFDKHYPRYRSLLLINKNIKELSLLGYVSKELDDYLEKEQLTLLSLAPQILSDLINGSETPFVYEKIGVWIDHYLLDEFQDTSEVQWKNFRPLLKESLSRNVSSSPSAMESMLVGDVKQSIYRFRDGKWELFKDKVKEDFKDNYDKKPLNVNHRSLKNIVEFNNFLFSGVEKEKWFEHSDEALPGALVSRFMDNLDRYTGAEKALSGTIAEIYRESAQHVKQEYETNGKKGVVHVISCGFDESSSKLSREDFILWDLARKIKYLTSSGGYSHNDIAILTDKKAQASKVANYLVDNGINIVSGESLKLDSNKVLATLVEIMKNIVNPNDKGLEVLRRLYGFELKNLSLLDASSEDGRLFMDRIRSCNTLYQMCKLMLRTFFNDLEEGDIAFVKAFLDRTLDYSAVNGTSIPDFLKWWDLTKDKLFIPEPSASEAVQIMTMHKAKGLGFKVVFIPYLRDEMIKILGNEKVWVTLPELGYDGPLLVPFSREMADSLYKDYYYNELMERSVDNLNLAYVTFTRAKERLYIYAKDSKNKTDGSISRISAALNEILPMISGEGKMFKACPETLESGETVTDYILGNDEETPLEEHNPQAAGFKCDIESSMLMKDSSRIKLRSVFDEDDVVRRGVLYHELFSYIDCEGNDEGSIEEKVGRAVSKFLVKNPGSILGDDAESLVKEVLGRIGEVREYGWFDEGKKIYAERSIISGKGNYRPDRVILPIEGKDWAVVVDYKFGEYEKDSRSDKSYCHQVRNYMNLLKEMEYSDVKGYLWYVLEGKVSQVQLIV